VICAEGNARLCQFRAAWNKKTFFNVHGPSRARSQGRAWDQGLYKVVGMSGD
jgi:hypothetical protein